MIKKMLKKGDGEKPSEEIKVDDNSVEALKAKLNQLNGDAPTDTNSQNTEGQTAAPAQNQNTGTGQVRVADAEFIADNERIINLIMQQIKELIEIDNNLNMKLKEIENKAVNITREVDQNKKTVTTFNERLENIEKNMEKFMGLYELVTNKYNPFIEDEKEEDDEEEEDTLPPKEDKPKKAIKKEAKPLPIQNNINEAVKHAKEEVMSETARISAEPKAPANTEKAAAQNKFAAMKAKMAQKEAAQQAGGSNIPTQSAADSAMSTINMITEEVAISERIQKLEESQAKIANLTSNGIIEEISPTNALPEISDSISENNPFNNPLLDKEIPSAYHLETEDGRTIQTLNDFVNLLQEMNDNELHEHIISQKDNYAKWLDLALDDRELTARFNSSENSKFGIISSLINLK